MRVFVRRRRLACGEQPLQVPARLTRGQRRRWLRLPRTWPWANALADAINKIRKMPLPTPQPG